MSGDIPGELLGKILDHLDVASLARCAQTSLTLRDAVYDDSRWVMRLRKMGVWSEEDAKRRIEEKRQRTDGTLFDANRAQKRQNRRTAELLSIAKNAQDPAHALYAIENVQSIRDKAMQEFARVYVALWPYYEDLASSQDVPQSKVFTSYRQPEDQAKMLQQLVVFERSVPVPSANLASVISLFEDAALREFEIAYDARDEVTMKRYAQVLTLLNGGTSVIDAFCARNPALAGQPPNPFACFDTFNENAAINLGPLQLVVDNLQREMKSQMGVIERVFPKPSLAWDEFCHRVFRSLLTDYIHKLLEYAQQQGTTQYLTAVTGSYGALHKLATELEIIPLLFTLYEDHVGFYLEEEASSLRIKARKEVEEWDRQIQEEAKQTETLLLSGINREAAKKNFLQSFAKVMLMPVNAVGSVIAGSSAGSDTITEAPIQVEGTLPTTELAARTAIADSGLARIKRLLSLEVALQMVHHARESIERARQFVPLPAPHGEEARLSCELMFADVVKLLGSRHVGIGFDLALESLKGYNPRDRKEANQVQPLVDFLELVHVADLVQQMFDLFFDRELANSTKQAPLAAAAKDNAAAVASTSTPQSTDPPIVDRGDFLSPANKEKKKLEQLIDAKVAEGLNRGIDVLIDQVDYILVTTQKPEDFRPWVVSSGGGDLRETEAAVKVVSCLRLHTDLLRGATDKPTLDVFLQEVCVRLYGSLCKHVKRQTVTVDGGLTLIADLNYYAAWVASLKQSAVTPYFAALKHVANVFIISGGDGRAVGQVVSDATRFAGVMRPEDVYEFVQRRADWHKVKRDVDRVLYGTKIAEDCVVM
ncbi:F-box protein: endocytic membrane traffic, recycling ReCYcling 1 [Savitreella phatthalungensis]